MISRRSKRFRRVVLQLASLSTTTTTFSSWCVWYGTVHYVSYIIITHKMWSVGSTSMCRCSNVLCETWKSPHVTVNASHETSEDHVLPYHHTIHLCTKASIYKVNFQTIEFEMWCMYRTTGNTRMLPSTVRMLFRSILVFDGSQWDITEWSSHNMNYHCDRIALDNTFSSWQYSSRNWHVNRVSRLSLLLAHFFSYLGRITAHLPSWRN